uniref:Uncharacterized protein n=1 Tax=Setaria viridis TaxID=4556 RepID=A0A4U6V0H5_SETVI|nr:hypothetical protein SEVIR_4G234601v2 [Setaria viridis]
MALPCRHCPGGRADLPRARPSFCMTASASASTHPQAAGTIP